LEQKLEKLKAAEMSGSSGKERRRKRLEKTIELESVRQKKEPAKNTFNEMLFSLDEIISLRDEREKGKEVRASPLPYRSSVFLNETYVRRGKVDPLAALKAYTNTLESNS